MPRAYDLETICIHTIQILAMEAGASQGWHRYVGLAGDVVSVERYGVSAPHQVLMREFGFTPEHVAARARALVGR